jgi:hypothetical protein
MAPTSSQAIPAFARKYNVKCYTCHMIPPVLNKTGYMFKRLGYRMPPDALEHGQKAPTIRELDAESRFSLTNSVALVTRGSFTAEKNTANSPQSQSSFNLDEAALFLAGAVPETNFSYFAQYELFQDGSNGIEQANVRYTAGRANNSFFVNAGMMHLQEGEGTRAATMYSLFPEASPLLGASNPLNFSLDQHPVGVNAGYTWAASSYKYIIGLSGKVTNGLNADGSEILLNSTKNNKDVWFDADLWFGPDGGVSFMTYDGRKDQIQNQGADDQFTFHPHIRRYGVFGNYLFFDKLDVIGSYLRSNDDWQAELTDTPGRFTNNAWRAEVDYYIQRGMAVMARYDRLNFNVTDIGKSHTNAWAIGALKALTERGNVVARASYGKETDMDPIAGGLTTDKLFRFDVRVMW